MVACALWGWQATPGTFRSYPELALCLGVPILHAQIGCILVVYHLIPEVVIKPNPDTC